MEEGFESVLLSILFLLSQPLLLDGEGDGIIVVNIFHRIFTNGAKGRWLMAG